MESYCMDLALFTQHNDFEIYTYSCLYQELINQLVIDGYKCHILFIHSLGDGHFFSPQCLVLLVFTGPFVFLWSCRCSLYVLDTNPSSYKCIANIFFQSLSWILILLTVVFREQTFLILMRSNLSIFYQLFVCGT